MEKLILPSLLNNSDVAFLAQRLLELSSPLTETDNKLKKIYDRLLDISNRLTANLKSTGKSLLTAEIRQLDKKCDQGFLSLRDQLHGLTLSLIEEKAAPAAELYAVIEKLGTSLHRLGYKAETALLESLFKSFDKQASQAQLNALGLLPDYASLKAAVALFEEARGQREEEKTVQATEIKPATDLVEEVVPQTTQLVAYMQLYSELEPETYGPVYDQMVTVIAEVNAAARARSTRNENEKLSETELN